MSQVSITDDLLAEIENIAAFINKNERQTTYLAVTKQIPAFKFGGKWHMRKSAYCRLIEKLEADAMADAGAVA
jgi:hypothetical protein